MENTDKTPMPQMDEVVECECPQYSKMVPMDDLMEPEEGGDAICFDCRFRPFRAV